MIKLKRLNPESEISSQNINDIKDAVEMAIEGDIYPSSIRLEDFTIEKKILPIKEILKNDDYGSWGQWEKNELRNLSISELNQELENFRGKKWSKRALEWLQDNNIPSIVIFPKIAIGDGRGRVSLAVGMGIDKLSVIMLKEK